MPLYLMIGPSITMPIPILVMVLFNVAVNSTSNPINYMGMAISVILFAAMGIMWTMLRKNYEESMEIEEGQVREQSYRNYIEKNEQLILQIKGFLKIHMFLLQDFYRRYKDRIPFYGIEILIMRISSL